MGLVPGLTFVSITGPTLDKASAKAMRAHTTRSNFARRRQRLVRDYADKKKYNSSVKPPHVRKDDIQTEIGLVADMRTSSLGHPGLDGKLNSKDAFFISHLTRAMERLHLVTNIPESDTALAVVQSDWARFLPDPTMLDVSLYFARHVYAARRKHKSFQHVLDAYKGKAIQSVRERLNDGSGGLSDSLVAAILILTVLNQGLDDAEAWKIHISGLLQVVTIRARNAYDASNHWTSTAVPRTAMQGLLLLSRHDSTVLNTVEKTGIFDTMFSASAKKAAYLILDSAEQVTALQQKHLVNRQLDTMEQLRIDRIIKSLDAAIDLDRALYPREAFLTAIALSLKIFLETWLRCTANIDKSSESTVTQLMEVFQRPEQQLPSSLVLCSSLESLFWQTMVAAIAAPEGRTKSLFMSRLDRITVALALTSWHDASVHLERYFWIPSIFSGPGHRIFTQVLLSRGRAGTY